MVALKSLLDVYTVRSDIHSQGQASIQFVHKLPGGNHEFWVKADCAENRVKFRLGK